MVKGQEYKMVYALTLKDFLKQREADSGDLGLCDGMDKEIWINVSEHAKHKCGADRMLETIFHEIGHAIMEEAGVTYGIVDTLEEIIVDTYSKDLPRLMKQFAPLLKD